MMAMEIMEAEEEEEEEDRVKQQRPAELVGISIMKF
jgi:hypothetical protein